jgi:molybdopterin synthase sulfur carrier subunit
VKITVKYFALLREAAGRDAEPVELENEAPVLGDLLDTLERRGGSLGKLVRERPVLCAVNMNYAGREAVLGEGDEVAIFPPVSGG